MKRLALIAILTFAANVHGKTFQNSYVAFEVPDDWTCAQEGVAWTCTPKNVIAAKEAVIVLAAKVAGPDDSVSNFLNYLKQPKSTRTKFGTPVPSHVMYAQTRLLANHNWVQSQHLGSEIQDYYTLYLATVKDQLAILVSFSAEKNRYKTYNAVFDRAMKTLRIVASQKLLFPKRAGGADAFGIQAGAGGAMGGDFGGDALPPPTKKKSLPLATILLALAFGLAVSLYLFAKRDRKNSSTKRSPPRPK